MASEDWQPLFVEPGEGCEREDAFSGPLGFMFGGMSVPTRLELSRQYFDAANVLLNSIKRQTIEDFALANPALFLYRHALELVLKAVLSRRLEGAPQGHDLVSLLADLDRFIQVHYQQTVPAWITRRIKEIAAIDPGSMAFRYGEDKYQGKRRRMDEEVYVSLPHLQAAMAEVYGALARAAGALTGPASA